MDPGPLYAPAKSTTIFLTVLVGLIVLTIIYKLWKK